MTRLLLLALALPCAAQPALDLPLAWERYGDQPFTGRLPPSLDQEGVLWFGGRGEYPARGALRLRPPYDTTATWEFARPNESVSWAYVVSPDTVLIEDWYLYRTVDGGNTWGRIDERPVVEDILTIPPGLPRAGRIVLARGTGMALFSDDRGASWQRATAFPTDAEARSIALVRAGPHAGRIVAAGISGLTVSDDGGRTWAPTPEWAYFAQSSGCVAALGRQAPGGGDRLVAMMNDPRVPDDSLRVTVSDDGGDSWRRVQGVFPGDFRACVGLVDLGFGRAVAIMMRGPVWGTEDGGETWRIWAPEPPRDPRAGPEADDDRAQWAWLGPGGRLYVGVYGYFDGQAWDVRTTAPVGSWEAVAAEPGVPEPSAGDLGLRVYPNPTGTTATVSLRLAAPGRVAVAVYDVQGREVAVLHDGPATDGERFPIETVGLPAGTYLVRATAAGASATAGLTVVH